MPEESRAPIESNSSDPGPFLAKVVSHLDPKYMGSLEVQLLKQVGDAPKAEGQLYIVKYASPFWGQTGFEFNNEENTYDGTQKSYGFWMIPPDVGSTVLVIFAEGDPKQGYWIACVQDLDMNFMTPGYATTSFNEDGDEERVPVAEYNKKVDQPLPKDTTKVKKPKHKYFVDILKEQGLMLDDIRGLTTSSARREVPSMVFGISTPGPVDKDGPTGKVGKAEHEITGAPISRLGGSSFVMDDGDDKFERKTKASEGPPDYATVEDGEKGDNKIPHNELIRIPTRTGHQILLHNSEDLIYIGNARGTSWIELTSDGKMDIYCEDSVSVHTKNDFNLYADRDINMEAGRNFNIKVKEEMHTHVLKDHVLIVDENQKIHIKMKRDETIEQELKQKVVGRVDVYHSNAFRHYAADYYDISVGGHLYMTSGGTNETRAGGNIIETAPNIHMNGPGAAQASVADEAELPKLLKTHSVPDQEGSELFQTIMRRVPIKEPWPHHENLDPMEFKPDKTDRDLEGRYEDNSEFLLKPEYFKKYTTKLDTFAKNKRD